MCQKFYIIRPTLLLMFITSFAFAAADPLSDSFKIPPDSAKPHTWWHWMNGNISRQGITADLEAMKRVGVGGAQIFIADCDIPAGPVRFMTPEFREMIKHAAAEADRLGLELCIHNCAGWSSSGGPWNTAEHAMQFVVSSETNVTGPAKFSAQLPQPPTVLDYYRDVAVFAFPATPGGQLSMKDRKPAIISNSSQVDPAKLVDGNAETEVILPRPQNDQPQVIELTFDEPFTARTISLTPGKGMFSCGGVVQASDDGKTFRDLRTFDFQRSATRPLIVSFGGAPIRARMYRVVFSRAAANTLQIPLAEIELSPALRIENLQAKAGFQVSAVETQSDVASDDQAIKRDALIDLTEKLDRNGRLTWDVPPGEWTILRIGHTPTGRENHPAPKEATGPECDKFSKDALDAHWAGYMQKVIDDLGPLAGKSLNNALIDSYEVGGQNWTPRMREEFQNRRGYDPTKFLPVMTGRVIDSPEISERFLWDMRRTIADLFAENYYGHFAELCHANRLKASIEPYTGPFESLQSGKPADIVMGEFWTGSTGHRSIKLAASVAHIYGKQIVGAESFTAKPPERGRWQEDPYTFKALGDLMYTQGINRFIFHRYAHQPWLDQYPGMTMGQWGFHFDRTNTWFEQSTAWLKYIARCQDLLQQGRFVADAAYFCGESSPVETKIGDPALPPGYDFDAINADVLLTRAAVKEGRIVLPDGMSYAALILPPGQDLMTPVLLQKIHDLIRDGATVVGPRPRRSPSLQGYPKCDQDVRALADEMWGNCDGKSVTEHTFAKGKVVWGQPMAEVFSSAKLAPDFETASGRDEKLAYIHRVVGDDEIYFVSNQRDACAQAKCVFRVSGKLPQLWHADTGVMENAPVFSEADGRTTVQLQFEPGGSVFVVFRKGEIKSDHLVEITPFSDGATLPAYELSAASDNQVQLTAWRSGSYELKKADGKTVSLKAEAPLNSTIAGPWELRFPPKWGAPEKVNLEKLISWTDHSDTGVKYFSGTATYSKEIAISSDMLADGRGLFLDLGKVKNLAEVKINGDDLGILWKPPFRVDLAGHAKAGKNSLEIRITNQWPNRLIGDEKLGEDAEWAGKKLLRWPQWLLDGKPSPSGRFTFTTWHHWTADMHPLESGLLGPVQLQSVQRLLIN